MTTTSPRPIVFKPASMSSSLSKTFAVPRKTVPSLPVILPTHPPGASVPFMIWMWPSFLIDLVDRLNLREVLRDRAAGDGHLLAIDQPAVEQHPHDRWHAPDAVQIF